MTHRRISPLRWQIRLRHPLESDERVIGKGIDCLVYKGATFPTTVTQLFRLLAIYLVGPLWYCG